MCFIKFAMISMWKKMEKPELGDDVHRSAFIVYLMNVHKECRLTDPCQQSSCGLGEKGRHNSYFFFPYGRKVKMRYLILWITNIKIQEDLDRPEQ